MSDQNFEIKNYKEAIVKLPYYEAGEDFEDSVIEIDEKCIDNKASILNHIELLKKSIKHLEELHNNIPDNSTLDIYGRRHIIGIYGDVNVVNNLIKKKLAIEGKFDDESYNTDNSSENCDDSDTSAEENPVSK